MTGYLSSRERVVELVSLRCGYCVSDGYAHEYAILMPMYQASCPVTLDGAIYLIPSLLMTSSTNACITTTQACNATALTTISMLAAINPNAICILCAVGDRQYATTEVKNTHASNRSLSLRILLKNSVL